MITFKKIRWKNFLSTGNTPIEIDLRKSNTTLIIGANGSGKSTLLDALCYGLFNRPFRMITLGGATDSSMLEGFGYTYEGSYYFS